MGFFVMKVMVFLVVGLFMFILEVEYFEFVFR